MEVNQNYPLLLLHLVDKSEINITIRIAGAVAFKNYIKRNWKVVGFTLTSSHFNVLTSYISLLLQNIILGGGFDRSNTYPRQRLRQETNCQFNVTFTRFDTKTVI